MVLLDFHVSSSKKNVNYIKFIILLNELVICLSFIVGFLSSFFFIFHYLRNLFSLQVLRVLVIQLSSRHPGTFIFPSLLCHLSPGCLWFLPLLLPIFHLFPCILLTIMWPSCFFCRPVIPFSLEELTSFSLFQRVLVTYIS